MSAEAFLNSPTQSSQVLVQSFDQIPLRTESELVAMGFDSSQNLFTIEEDGVLRKWDINQKKELARLQLDPMVPLWRFSTDAQIAVAATDALTVYETSEGEVIWEVNTFDWITALAIPHNKELIVTGHEDGKIRIWQKGKKKPVREASLTETGISALEFSKAGDMIAIATEDRLIHILNAENFQIVGTLKGHKDRIPSLAWSNDGKKLYSAGWDTTVRVWDISTFKPIILLNSHAVQVQTLALSPDGELLASADSDLLVRLWSTNRYTEVAPARELSEEIRFLQFTPDGKLLASGGFLHVSMWESQVGSLESLATHPGVLHHRLKYDGKNNQIFCLNPGSPFHCWDVKSTEVSQKFCDLGQLASFDLSTDGNHIIGAFSISAENSSSYSPNCSIGIWSSGSGELNKLFDCGVNPATSITTSPDSKFLAFGSLLSPDAEIRTFPDCEPVAFLPDAVQGFSLTDLKFVPGSKNLVISGLDWFASSGRDGMVTLWNLTTGKREHVWNFGAMQLAISADGKWLACALPGKQVHQFCLQTKNCVAKHIEFQDAVTGMSYSPDSKIIAIASEDRQIRFWRAATTRFIGSLMVDFRVKAIDFHSNGTNLFALGADGYACRLDISQFLELSSDL
jgi:WD40 repeat protein